MILRATHNPFIDRFFRLYTLLKIRLVFREVVIEGNVSDRGMPVLVIANHFSWWDGFWVMYMNLKLFHRKFYFMMLQEQLIKNIFLNKAGGYSVKRGSRSIIESLQYTTELLKDKNNLVLLFPQGKIVSLYQSRISFEKGIERVIGEIDGKAQVLFEANLIEYFSHARPSLYIYLGEYNGSKNKDDIEKSYNEFYLSVLEKHSDKKGSE